ncbi:S8 family peptidase [Camelimonas sp. ID_303_24]
MWRDIRQAGARNRIAMSVVALLLTLPFAGAQAQSEWRQRPDYSGGSDAGRAQRDDDGRAGRWRGQSGDAPRAARPSRAQDGWRDHHEPRRFPGEARPRPPGPLPYHQPHHPPRPRPRPGPDGAYYPPPAWGPAPWRQPGYPAPVYLDEDDDAVDMPPAPQPRRRAPARAAPEKAVAPPKPPRRPPPVVAPPAPPAPARADSGVPAAGETRFAPREVLVTLATSAGAPAAEPLARDLARSQRLRLLTIRPLALTGVLLVRYQIPDQRTVSAVITLLERDSRVLSAQPNYLYTLTQAETSQPAASRNEAPQAETSRTGTAGAGAAQPATTQGATPPTPSRGGLAASQYGLERLRAGVAQVSAKGAGVLTAVIDSGVDGKHRELAGAVAQAIDVTQAGAGGAPADAHGTAIAGIIAARDQMSGVAPGAQLVAIRAFAPAAGKTPGEKAAASHNGAHGSSLTVILALEAAAQAKARVVNMSFAGPRDPLLSKALAAAAGKGMILVAAVGNDGPEAPPAWPAADPNVIAVTATDASDQRVAVANRGPHVAVAAPGADIIGPTPGNAYQFSTGSSMAAAHVTGAVALLLETNPALTPSEARKILTETAKDLGPAGRDADTGAGLVDAGAAVDAARKMTAPETTSSAQ